MLSSLRSARPAWPVSLAPRIHSRNVISVQPPRVYPRKTVPRRYSERKTYLYNQYTKLLETSASSPIIFLQHADFTAKRLERLRRDISVAANKAAPSLATPSPHPVSTSPEPQLTVIKTAIFGVALRDFAPLDKDAIDGIAGLVEGGLAVLTLPVFNPPQLNAILRTMDRTVPPRKPETEEDRERKRQAKLADPETPGKETPRPKEELPPGLILRGAMIDGRVFKPDSVKQVAQLPTLQTLHAQIVGLLSTPATQLAGVLSEASGGKLARTLEGLKKSLEEAQAPETQSPP
ncbi:hypothetical protein PLICRDRAFT_49930 [Plicaturopsis crispa FD-325 SS-3]|nr:hypothetical protein PLICRDRAFT_49930 [Plicaturopsis crispa FD-325 SS-3]